MLLSYKSSRSIISAKEISYPVHLMAVNVSPIGCGDSIFEAHYE